jgi:magnesium transporter
MDGPAGPALNTRESLQDFALGDDYALNPRYVELVVDAADRNDGTRLAELLAVLRPADVADLMGFLQADYRDDVLAQLPPDVLAEVLPELDDQIREDVLEDLAPARLAAAVAELDSDDAAAVIEDLDEDRQRAVLAAMPDIERMAVESSLAHQEETAGRLMQREVVAAPQFWTVGHAIDHMREAPDELPDQFFDIYLVDPAFKPVGAVPLATLLKSRRDIRLTDLMEPITEIDVAQDQEEVAYIFEKYRLISAPVVDDSGRLVGQITVDDIVGVLQEENQEDILALAGVGDEGRDATTFGAMRSRLPWLAVNLFTALLSAIVISCSRSPSTSWSPWLC